LPVLSVVIDEFLSDLRLTAWWSCKQQEAMLQPHESWCCKEGRQSFQPKLA
jgi:hypothetical protein